jgi:hypothetical protein
MIDIFIEEEDKAGKNETLPMEKGMS